MEYFARIDVSLEESSVCVVDSVGRIVREAKVASELDALVGFFRALGFAVDRIGLEAGPLSQWLHAGLRSAGFAVVLLEQPPKGGSRPSRQKRPAELQILQLYTRCLAMPFPSLQLSQASTSQR